MTHDKQEDRRGKYSRKLDSQSSSESGSDEEDGDETFRYRFGEQAGLDPRPRLRLVKATLVEAS